MAPIFLATSISSSRWRWVNCPVNGKQHNMPSNAQALPTDQHGQQQGFPIMTMMATEAMLSSRGRHLMPGWFCRPKNLARASPLRPFRGATNRVLRTRKIILECTNSSGRQPQVTIPILSPPPGRTGGGKGSGLKTAVRLALPPPPQGRRSSGDSGHHFWACQQISPPPPGQPGRTMGWGDIL